MQVLLATQLRRTPSLACPDLFHFDEHFIFLSVLGRTRLSEVELRPCKYVPDLCKSKRACCDWFLAMQVYHVKHRETGESFAVKRSTKKLVSKAHRERYTLILNRTWLAVIAASCSVLEQPA